MRYFYADTISGFLQKSKQEILGFLSQNNSFSLEQTQRGAWIEEIRILKKCITDFRGTIFFEFSIPRMGSRVDVVLLIEHVIFVIEFKVGERDFQRSAIDQVMDYALDLKNFHETSHHQTIAPVLLATNSPNSMTQISYSAFEDNILQPVLTNEYLLSEAIKDTINFSQGSELKQEYWASGRYSPTPTIIEAAMSLYHNHSVSEITRNDASGENIERTSLTVSEIIDRSKEGNLKSICFITGVPGAGKTLIGLDIATKYLDETHGTTSVFLSGNGPLVAILREALTRDKFSREKALGNNTKKGDIFREVKMFIQGIHHFRDECIIDPDLPPFDHVAIFDEAQRAWNQEQTARFMSQKRNQPGFTHSEPEFLISCMDRHKDWAVIICLVGGGQEIHTGEAGIGEWIESLNRSFPEWHIHISPNLVDSEYAAGTAIELLSNHPNISWNQNLHLAVSMRSFRAENVSLFVKQLLDLQVIDANKTYHILKDKYPIVITRNLRVAKQWLKDQARGSERYGITVSSQAIRLKPHAIDVRCSINPIHWFLNDREDIRSSYYLEDVATEFQIQGLELDWVCVMWDGDFRYSPSGWQSFSFVGKRWNRILKEDRKQYLKNAYRVLLTRARQGMVIVVPEGDSEDPTRAPKFYDETFTYLLSLGIQQI